MCSHSLEEDTGRSFCHLGLGQFEWYWLALFPLYGTWRTPASPPSISLHGEHLPLLPLSHYTVTVSTEHNMLQVQVYIGSPHKWSVCEVTSSPNCTKPNKNNTIPLLLVATTTAWIKNNTESFTTLPLPQGGRSVTAGPWGNTLHTLVPRANPYICVVTIAKYYLKLRNNSNMKVGGGVWDCICKRLCTQV